MAQVREKYDSSGHQRRCQLPGLVCGQGGVLWQPTGSRQREEREFCHCQKLATSTRDQARQFCYQISAKELSLVLKVLDHVDFEFQRKRTKSVSVSHKRTINWNILNCWYGNQWRNFKCVKYLLSRSYHDKRCLVGSWLTGIQWSQDLAMIND